MELQIPVKISLVNKIKDKVFFQIKLIINMKIQDNNNNKTKKVRIF